MITNTNKHLYPSLQLLTFMAITIGVIAVGYFIGAALVTWLYGADALMAIAQQNFSAPYISNTLWILQIVSTTIPIMAVSLIFAYAIVREPAEYLKPKLKVPPLLWVLVFCMMFISSPVIELLSNINQKLVLPHFLDGIQKWMRDSEDQAKKLTDILLHMTTIGDMIIRVLVIGLLTAIVEEFMFRGCIQTIFMRWTKNTHAAIWITAVLFSAFHMEFFGFLPRLMLGVLFGYFVAWSGSIWTGVWAHFINNSAAVVATYFFQNKMTKLNPDDQHIFNYGSYLFSFIIILFLLYLYRDIATGKKKLPAL
ncbi:MAG TPA: CPBP family intramembrane glutamic endopeptidase [Mucilaginibacter sp.]|nr:CPBP family intramembrane glutamic endopeptidase [Mucilaginibacter sp.]